MSEKQRRHWYEMHPTTMIAAASFLIAGLGELHQRLIAHAMYDPLQLMDPCLHHEHLILAFVVLGLLALGWKSPSGHSA